MHFVPKMKYSTRGHFVSIQPSSKAARRFLDSNSEIHSLIKHLTVDFPISEAFPDNKPKMSTVIYKEHKSDSNLNIVNLKRQKIAREIIEGIEYQRMIIRLSDKTSLIDSIFKYVRAKIA